MFVHKYGINVQMSLSHKFCCGFVFSRSDGLNQDPHQVLQCLFNLSLHFLGGAQVPPLLAVYLKTTGVLFTQ